MFSVGVRPAGFDRGPAGQGLRRSSTNDGAGIFRSVRDDYIDYSGVLRSPGEDFIDNSGTLRSPGEGFIDGNGIYRGG